MAFHFVSECVGPGSEGRMLAPLYHEQEAPELSRPPAADHLLSTQNNRVIVALNMKGSP